MSSSELPIEAHLEVGCTALVHPLPTRPGRARYRAIMRGWQQGSNIIFEVLTEGAPYRQALFQIGEMLAVRYVHNGMACGFATQVLDQDPSRHPMTMRVAWPKRIEQISVRRHERIPLSVNCRLTFPDGASEVGMIVDMSCGGCAIRCKPLPEQRSGQKCGLSFALPDGFAVEGLESYIRSVRTEGNVSTLGCEFMPLEEITREAIHFFVTATLERTKASDGASRRVLLVEHRRDVIRFLSHELKKRSYDVSITMGVVDACYRLRMMPPSGLLVSHELHEISSSQFCRLIHGTPGLEKLPILVYGGDDSELERLVREAGAMCYVPSAYAIEEFEAALEQWTLAPQATASVRLD